MKFLRFILSHSIFIAFCAVALCFQTCLLLKINVPTSFYGFVFFATVCTYNLYWLLSIFSNGHLSILQLVKKRPTNSAAFVISFLLTVIFIFPFYYLYLPVCIGLGLTFFYIKPLLHFNNIKKINRSKYFKTILLAFTWAFVTVILPATFIVNLVFVKLAMVFFDRFLFMLMLCIIFDKRDASIDLLQGLNHQNSDFKSNKIDQIFFIVFLLSFINMLAFQLMYQSKYSLLGSLIVSLATTLVYFLSKKSKGYYFYYFLVDGLMLFSAFVMYMVMN
jgi:hypothetical protein